MSNAAARPKENICVGLLAHVDAGKTTLSEAMLYLSGRLRKLGRVDRVAGDVFVLLAHVEQHGVFLLRKDAPRLFECDLSYHTITVSSLLRKKYTRFCPPRSSGSRALTAPCAGGKFILGICRCGGMVDTRDLKSLAVLQRTRSSRATGTT